MSHAHGVGADPGFHQALQFAMEHWRSMREIATEDEAPTDDES